MKLFAQHGFGDGTKVDEGLAQGLIDGVIFSPRDIKREKLRERIATIRGAYPALPTLIDPQFYVYHLGGRTDHRLGFLPTDYKDYFRSCTRRDLERDTSVTELIEKAIAVQEELEVHFALSPNILIQRSFDSIDAAISKRFVELAALSRPGQQIVTLAVSRDALLQRTELTQFLQDICGLRERPRGFYLLVSAASADAKSEIFNADVIGAWMFMNHVLSVNGYEVINGYSDLLTPFLAATGASAGASGWWGNLRRFSLARFEPAGGGRLPTPRYLSTSLLGRLTFVELDRVRRRIPSVLNGLPTDGLYPETAGSAVERPHEVLQSWSALQQLTADVPHSIDAAIAELERKILHAREMYDQVAQILDSVNTEHLDALHEGLRVFQQLAEL